MNRCYSSVGSAVLLLGSAACAEPHCSVVGQWEGQVGASLLVFRFRPDGDATISVTVGHEMSTAYCRWERAERRILLSNSRGQVRWLAVVQCAPDELTLRLDASPAGVCHLRRTGEG